MASAAASGAKLPRGWPRRRRAPPDLNRGDAGEDQRVAGHQEQDGRCGRGGGGGQAGPDRGAAEDASGRPDRCERPEGLCERRRSRSPSTPRREYWWVPGWPAAPVHLCLQSLGRCDLLRPPAKFRLRRILRRLPPRTIVFPQKNQIVRCPTRGATPTWQRVAVRGRGWQNLLPLGVSGGCGAGTSAWCHSMPPPASNPYVAVYVTPKANLRSGGNSQCRRAGGLWAASVTQSGRATLTRAPLLRLSGRKTRTSSGRRLPRAGGCNTHGRFALQPVAG